MKQLLEQCAGWLSGHQDDEEAQELQKRIQATLRLEEGFFVVSRVSRDDLTDKGFDGDAVDDETMEKIASSMGKAHTEYGDYWLSLEHACWNENVPRLEDRKENVEP